MCPNQEQPVVIAQSQVTQPQPQSLRLGRFLITVFFSTIILPILLAIIFIPLWIFRKFLALTVPLVRKDLSAILVKHSSLLTTNIHDNVIMCVLHFEKPLDIAIVRKTVWERLVTVQDDGGRLLYPELQQYHVHVAGYPFWKQESEFRLEDHVYVHKSVANVKEEDVDRSLEMDLQAMEQEVMEKPFVVGKSPWEFVILGDRVLALKAAHSLCDGAACFNVFMTNLADKKPQQLYKPKKNANGKQIGQNPLRSMLSAVISWLKIPFDIISFPYKFVQDQIELAGLPKTVIKPGGGEPKQNVQLISTKTARICSSGLKELRLRLKLFGDGGGGGVSLFAILVAGLAGGVRNFLLQNGHSVPEVIPLMIPMPTGMKLPRKLVNSFCAITLRLPVGECDPLNRLQLIEHALCKAKNSTLPQASFIVNNLIGTLPVGSMTWDPKTLPLAFSNFPGPAEKMTFFGGVPLQDFYYYLWVTNQRAFLTLITYNDGFRVTMNIQKSKSSDGRGPFPDKQAVDKLSQLIEHEYKVLGQMATTLGNGEINVGPLQSCQTQVGVNSDEGLSASGLACIV